MFNYNPQVHRNWLRPPFTYYVSLRDCSECLLRSAARLIKTFVKQKPQPHPSPQFLQVQYYTTYQSQYLNGVDSLC